MYLSECIEKNKDLFKKKYGNIILPTRIVDKGEKLTVRLESYEGPNAAFAITHNSFSDDALAEPIHIELHEENGKYVTELEIEFSEAGNTKLELWCGADDNPIKLEDGNVVSYFRDGGRIMRQVAVLDKGYAAVIPWMGSNVPVIDREIHRFDLPGDFWLGIDIGDGYDDSNIKNIAKIVNGAHLYGDRPAVMFSAGNLLPGYEGGGSVFQLDYETQKNGLTKIHELLKQMGIDNPELFACYTPDARTMEILESLGIKGLTSLCVWQNWQDGGDKHGWKINHTGAANQPFYPSDDDFRKNGEKRKLMCFSMGSSSCNRNYSIMAYDGCASNVSQGQRYKNNRVEHFQVQRFYDAFDSFLDAAKNSDELVTVTMAIEAFRGFADWNAVNEMAVRHAVRKAAKEKIVFASAADIAEYHIRKGMDMQRAYFFQFDNYYGQGCCEMPGHVADRIEADDPEYLAVIKRGSMRPMFFFDYTEEWSNEIYKSAGRNKFGLVNPDKNDPSDWDPAQVESRDIRFSSQWEGDTLIVRAESDTPKKRMVTGVFDIPFAKDFTFTVDKKDAKAVKIFDTRGDNVHFFIDMGALSVGMNEVRISVSGERRTPDNYVLELGRMGVMLFGDHAYLRSLDREGAVSVKMNAPDSAYIIFPSGKKLRAQDGMLEFTLNTEWFDECPVLYGYDREALAKAKVETADLGPTKCPRWF